MSTDKGLNSLAGLEYIDEEEWVEYVLGTVDDDRRAKLDALSSHWHYRELLEVLRVELASYAEAAEQVSLPQLLANIHVDDPLGSQINQNRGGEDRPHSPGGLERIIEISRSFLLAGFPRIIAPPLTESYSFARRVQASGTTAGSEISWTVVEDDDGQCGLEVRVHAGTVSDPDTCRLDIDQYSIDIALEKLPNGDSYGIAYFNRAFLETDATPLMVFGTQITGEDGN
jgi:hypothetical protein